MPRILRIINRFNLGGPSYNAAYLSKYLAPEFETMLVGGVKEDHEESSEFILKELGISPVVIPEMRRSLNPFNDLIVLGKIRNIIRKFKPDIVHTHAAKAGTLGRLAARFENVRVVFHTFHGHVFHSYFNPVKTKIYISIERYLAARSTRIIAVSEMQKKDLSERFRICDPKKTEVIRLGFDLERFRTGAEQKRATFRKEYFLDDDEIAIGIIGRLVPIKNHRMFIKAFAKVRQVTKHRIRAFIIGDGELLNELTSYARSLEIDFSLPGNTKKATLHFTSWIRGIDSALHGLDIVALTSDNEGTPVSLIEAQACGIPVVTTDAGGTADTVLPGKSGFVCKTGDIEDFSQKLLVLISDPVLSHSFGENGRIFAFENYGVERLVSETKLLYHRTLSEPPPHDKSWG